MTLQPDSWHYRIANVYGRGEFYRRTDLCTYARCFALGTLICLFVVGVGVLMGYGLILAPMLWLVMCIVEKHLFVPIDEVVVGLVFWGLASIVTGVIYWAVHREDMDKPVIPIPEPIREAYRSWREKYCVPLEIAE